MKSDLEIAEFWYIELIESLRLICSEYEIQTKVLPEFVHLPDELLNSLPVDAFDTLLKNGLISKEEFENLTAFNKQLDQITFPEDYDEMLEIISNSSQFKNIKDNALALLIKLGHSYKEPKINATYIQCS